MSLFSHRLLNIVYLNYSNGQDQADTPWNNLLTNFQDIAFRLKHEVLSLKNVWRKWERFCLWKTCGENEKRLLFVNPKPRYICLHFTVSNIGLSSAAKISYIWLSFHRCSIYLLICSGVCFWWIRCLINLRFPDAVPDAVASKNYVAKVSISSLCEHCLCFSFMLLSPNHQVLYTVICSPDSFIVYIDLRYSFISHGFILRAPFSMYCFNGI
jgi:hypothetical protein